MALTTVQAGLIGSSPTITSQSVNFGIAVYEQTTSTLSTSFAITTGSSAFSFGPVTVADGITIVVPDGAVWTVL
jgi:hypothetical protein